MLLENSDLVRQEAIFLNGSPSLSVGHFGTALVVETRPML